MDTSFAPISPAARDALNRVRWDSFTGMSHLHGFNYQPSWGHDARSIWLDDFDPDRYRAELETGRRLFPGFNCVRIWLGYGAYVADRELFLRNFHRAVDICVDLDLLVIPVLFTVWDAEPSFDPIELEGLVGADLESTFASYLADVIAPQRGNPSILAWDLCNEPRDSDAMNGRASVGARDWRARERAEAEWRPLAQAQTVWLTFVHDRVRSLDPDARTCIGTAIEVGWGERLSHLCDVLTPHLYGYLLWKPSHDAGLTPLTFADWFEAMVDKYQETTRLLDAERPILVSETCWGADSDAERVEVIRGTLSALQRHGMGFLAHALVTSGVADLHRLTEEQRVIPGGYPHPASMEFTRPDGTLRPGHDAFNDYTG